MKEEEEEEKKKSSFEKNNKIRRSFIAIDFIERLGASVMLSQPTPSNLSEALINVKKLEKNFLDRQLTFLDRDRNKIRANVDRHMESFLQLTRKRHETWYRHDKHFREAIRKEKDQHEKRKERARKKFLLQTSPDYDPRPATPFQVLTSESVVLPPIITKTSSSVIETTPRAEPMTKVERRTHQVLRESQKLLDESAARTRDRIGRSSSTFFQRKPTPVPSSSSCSFNSATLIVPLITSSDCEEYDRLMNESLQHENFSEFVDHFVKFRPEYREQFGLIHEASKRQRAMDKLRAHNQIYAKAKDERYHRLIDSLTHLPSEQKEKKY